MPLTIKGIEAAKDKYIAICGKYVQTKLSDGDGLFLIITEKTKSWRARYFYMGKEQTLSLGKYPLVSLKDAREKNFMLRQELDKGINPAEEKKKEKAQIKAVVYFSKSGIGLIFCINSLAIETWFCKIFNNE